MLIASPAKPEDRITWLEDGDLADGSDARIKENRLNLNNITSDLIDNNNEPISELVKVIGRSENTSPMQTRQFSCAGFIGLPISVGAGIVALDVSINATDAFSVDYKYSTRPPKIPKINQEVRPANSRIRRATFR